MKNSEGLSVSSITCHMQQTDGFFFCYKWLFFYFFFINDSWKHSAAFHRNWKRKWTSYCPWSPCWSSTKQMQSSSRSLRRKFGIFPQSSLGFRRKSVPMTMKNCTNGSSVWKPGCVTAWKSSVSGVSSIAQAMSFRFLKDCARTLKEFRVKGLGIGPQARITGSSVPWSFKLG